MSEYIFVHKNKGWWLKVSSAAELFEYYENTDNIWSDTFENLIKSKEFSRNGMTHASDLAYNIGMFGSRQGLGPLQATLQFRNDKLASQLDAIARYGEIYINKAGGYHFKCGTDTYDQFVRRKEFVFPDYKQNEIRVKQFPGGTHFYAYVGDMQVRDGDILKWDTYEQAHRMAQSIVTKCDS